MTLPGWLATTRQYLLILDDLMDPTLLQEISPASLAGHILITTRARDLALPQPAAALDLARLDTQSSSQLLLRLSAQSFPPQTQDQTVLASASAFHDLARELSGQPLALTLAGTHIKASGVSFARFLQDYRAFLEQVPAFQERLDGFSRELAALVSLSITSLQQNNPRASEILEMCAFLAPIAIPTLLLKPSNTTASTPACAEQRQADLDHLLAFGLLSCLPSNQIISIHPLLQQAIQSMLPLEQQRQRVVYALRVLLRLSSLGQDNPTWRLRILAHIHHCAHCAEPWTFTEAEIARTFAWAAAALEEHNSLGAALFLRRKALAIWERVPGTARAALIELRQKQILLCDRLKNFPEAESLLHQIIADCTSLYSPDHPMIIVQLVRLARIYRARNSNKEAEACYTKALALSRRGHHKFDQLVIAIQHELAMFYMCTRDFSSSEFLLQDVSTAFELQLGLDHPETLNRALELAVACMLVNKWDKAEALTRKVSSSIERNPATPLAETLRAWHTLALTLIAQARWEDAAATYRRIIDLCVETRGRLHPDLLPYLTELLCLYQIPQNKQTEKQITLAWIQEIREDQFAHPQTDAPGAILENLNALGSLYLAQSRFVDAENLFMRSVLLSERWQLKDPLALAINLSALAITQAAQGDGRRQQTGIFLQAALTVWQHILGPASPEISALQVQYEQWLHENTS
jgi:tetratricopeptide (TPR) repeat protein